MRSLALFPGVVVANGWLIGHLGCHLKNQVRRSILACFLLAMEEIVEEGFNQGAWPHTSGKTAPFTGENDSYLRLLKARYSRFLVPTQETSSEMRGIL